MKAYLLLFLLLLTPSYARQLTHEEIILVEEWVEKENRWEQYQKDKAREKLREERWKKDNGSSGGFGYWSWLFTIGFFILLIIRIWAKCCPEPDWEEELGNVYETDDKPVNVPKVRTPVAKLEPPDTTLPTCDD